MRYTKFVIHQYKGIENDLEVDLTSQNLLALIGLNECGKSSILKALLAFDSYNDDKNNEVNHLERLKNYYHVSLPEQLKVSAHIQLTDCEEFKTEVYNFITSKNLYENFNITRDISESGSLENIQIDSEKFLKKYYSLLSSHVIVTRTYSKTNNYYQFNNEKIELNDGLQNEFSKLILKYTPICLYVNNKIPLEEKVLITRENQSKFWYKIFDNLCMKACNISLFDIANNPDGLEQRTHLNKINEMLNVDFNQSWNDLGMDNEFTNRIRLLVDIKRNSSSVLYLDVSLQELVQGKTYEDSFELEERSDGFKWYYSFVMHLLYNPIFKSENNNNVLFLLDEPGTNLNPKSQVGLLKRFNEIIAENNNTQIIYTTHSSYMLNQDYIKPNQILIAKKDKAKSIVLYNIKTYPQKYTKLSALTPLYDSLQLPFLDKNLTNRKVVLVEGIHDFYALELFCNLGKDYEIFPCWSATSIIKNIPFFLMWHQPFVYLVDNDLEGVEKAHKVIESEYFNLNKGVVLPFPGYLQDKNQKYEMDDVFQDKIKSWSRCLGCANTYTSVIEFMYNNRTKEEVKQLLKDLDIQERFKRIKTKIKEKF